MIDPASYEDFFGEAYTIEKTVEVRAQTDKEFLTFRIEALSDRKGNYTTRVYQQEEITLQPANSKAGEKYNKFLVWVEVNYDLPVAPGKEADEVLRRARSCLRDRFKK
jgi:hypothetical protein